MRLLALSIALVAAAFTSCTSGGDTGVGSQSAKQPRATNEVQPVRSQPCLNMNTASAKELASLPTIGEVVANRIVEYREGHGGFRRAEEIIIIEGFSEKKYFEIAKLICVE